MATIKDYFNIKELVCKHVYSTFKETKSWEFFDPKLLETLLFIREGIGKPITVNNWHIGGNFTQRGLRCNLCQLVLEKSKANKIYVSAHMQGDAVDFDVHGMTAAEVRRWIADNKEELPYPIRLENNTNWVHLDVRNHSKLKISYFNG